MSFDKAKLLAYALGELDKNEARRVEAYLKTNEDAARFVRETQLFAGKVQTELSKEKIPAGQGITGLERAAGRAKAAAPSRSQNKIGLVEASAGFLVLLAIILYWSKPWVGDSATEQQTDATLDFYPPTYSSLSGGNGNQAEKTLSALQVKNSLAEWNNRPKLEEVFGPCTFYLPKPANAEAGLTKTAADQKAWFYLLNEGETQVRAIMDSSDCVLALDMQANVSPDGQAEADEILQGIESELNTLVKDGR